MDKALGVRSCLVPRIISLGQVEMAILFALNEHFTEGWVITGMLLTQSTHHPIHTSQALKLVQAINPPAEPNEGYWAQLLLFQDMRCR